MSMLLKARVMKFEAFAPSWMLALDDAAPVVIVLDAPVRPVMTFAAVSPETDDSVRLTPSWLKSRASEPLAATALTLIVCDRVPLERVRVPAELEEKV